MVISICFHGGIMIKTPLTNEELKYVCGGHGVVIVTQPSQGMDGSITFLNFDHNPNNGTTREIGPPTGPVPVPL